MNSLSIEVRDAERRVIASRERLRAHTQRFRRGWRQHINPAVLLAVGAALGALAGRMLHRPRLHARHGIQRATALVRRLPLLPIAQLALARWLASERHKPRSINRADHSAIRVENGRFRH